MSHDQGAHLKLKPMRFVPIWMIFSQHTSCNCVRGNYWSYIVAKFIIVSCFHFCSDAKGKRHRSSSNNNSLRYYTPQKSLHVEGSRRNTPSRGHRPPPPPHQVAPQPPALFSPTRRSVRSLDGNAQQPRTSLWCNMSIHLTWQTEWRNKNQKIFSLILLFFSFQMKIKNSFIILYKVKFSWDGQYTYH